MCTVVYVYSITRIFGIEIDVINKKILCAIYIQMLSLSREFILELNMGKTIINSVILIPIMLIYNVVYLMEKELVKNNV